MRTTSTSPPEVYFTVNGRLIWSVKRNTFVNKNDSEYLKWIEELALKDCPICDCYEDVFTCCTDYMCHHKNRVSSIRELISTLQYYDYPRNNLCKLLF